MDISDNNILSNYSPEWLNHCHLSIPGSLSRVFAYSWLADWSQKEESLEYCFVWGERSESICMGTACVGVSTGSLREKEESLPARHHWLSYRSVDLLISGVPGLERGRGVGG